MDPRLTETHRGSLILTKDITTSNAELLSIIREKEKWMTDMRVHMEKQDLSIMSNSQKDLTLQIMSIKIEEINAFFLQLLKRLAIQQEKEKETHKRQYASIGEAIKNSYMKDPNMINQIKRGHLLKSSNTIKKL